MCAPNFPPATTGPAPGGDTPPSEALRGSVAQEGPRGAATRPPEADTRAHDERRRSPADLSGDRRDRLHRRAAGARTAGGRPPGAGDESLARAAAGPPVGRPGGGRAG